MQLLPKRSKLFSLLSHVPSYIHFAFDRLETNLKSLFKFKRTQVYFLKQTNQPYYFYVLFTATSSPVTCSENTYFIPSVRINIWITWRKNELDLVELKLSRVLNRGASESNLKFKYLFSFYWHFKNLELPLLKQRNIKHYHMISFKSKTIKYIYNLFTEASWHNCGWVEVPRRYESVFISKATTK